MTRSKTDSAALSAKQATVKSRETGKVYRVVRSYRNSLLVTPAWRKHGYKMTMPKSAFLEFNPHPNSPEVSHEAHMISAHTRQAITALLAVDPSATDDEREAVAQALQGKQSGPAVLSIKEVCRRLGRTRQTVYNLVKRGLLQPVRGGGCGGMCTGITTQSLSRYLQTA